MDDFGFGSHSGHSIGIILKELVRRAEVVISNERLNFEVTSKAGYDGTMDDVFTSADRKAQDIITKSLNEIWPEFGCIGEESKVHNLPEGMKGYFTIDPLDGTKAFVRRQSHGVATMIAMVITENYPDRPWIASAFIGDVNTREIYFSYDTRNKTLTGWQI